MHYPKTLLICLLTLSFSAIASSQLDRLQEAQQTLAAKAKAHASKQAPRVAALMPDMSWDAEYRAAMQCYLNQVESRHGASAVSQYLSDLEAFVAQDFTSFSALNKAPSGLNDDEMFPVSTECGVIEISKKRMQESGYNAIFSDPELMQELTKLIQQE